MVCYQGYLAAIHTQVLCAGMWQRCRLRCWFLRVAWIVVCHGCSAWQQPAAPSSAADGYLLPSPFSA
jgi:hypothetical protein